jgi:TolB-like protein
MSFFDELKRRNVVRVAIVYVITAWLVLQMADVVLNNIEAPGWVFQVIMLVLGLSLPIVLVFAWAFEMTPEGLKRERDVDRGQSITHHTSRKLDFAIIAVLVLALGYFAYDKFVLQPTGGDAPSAAGDDTAKRDEPTAAGAPQQANVQGPAEKSIAVIPFVNLSSDPEQEYFSDGISEELLNVLAQLPGLRVAARTSSFQFKGKSLDISQIADTLNVAHILEGSVRKSGTKLRITAQLIKADDGFHIWSKTYDREMTDIFTIQDEIAGAISEALKVQLELAISRL